MSGGAPDFNGGSGGFAGRSLSTNNPHVPYTSQFHDPVSQIVERRPDLTGKRSLAELQAHHLQQQASIYQLQHQQASIYQLQPQQASIYQLQEQQEQRMNLYIRNVRQRNFQQPSLISSLSPSSILPTSSGVGITAPQGYPIQQQIQSQQPVSFGIGNGVLPLGNNSIPVFGIGNGVLPLGNNSIPVSSYDAAQLLEKAAAQLLEKAAENKIKNCLLELEKQLLDDDYEEQGDAVSDITCSEWSETFQDLLSPPPPTATTSQMFFSPSPTSSTSSCTSPSMISPKQSLMDAASAISEGKTDVATEILARLNQLANTRGTSEQKITAYLVSALKSRINPAEYPPPMAELYSKEHNLSTQMLYEASPCFKFGFMAANLAILEAISGHPSGKLHVVDFDVGKGSQLLHLIHSIAADRKMGIDRPTSLKITSFVDIGCDSEDRMKEIGDMLKEEADEVGVFLNFNINHRNSNTFISLENLIVDPDEALAVNFAFQLYKLPDESVTTENLRDQMLRQVKRLSPTVVTLVEQDMNVNTASFKSRVPEVYDYYGPLFESLDTTVPIRDNPERVRVEEGLGRRVANSVACEGNNRTERCEVLGKWAVRMGMAGFKGRVLSLEVSDSLRASLLLGTRGNPGFTVKEENGRICIGWKGKTLTVASAWQ